ncbi:MAG: hypothetical protein J2P31_17710, partial [Blastocatellia bacterium]|nr:hypothetical protein [Blastocatellia bacterium]
MREVKMRRPITLDQIKNLAAAWYSALDAHAPITECYRMLADDGLNMHFPSGDIHDFAMFEKWYGRVTSRFFDEQHTIRQVEIKWCTDEQAGIEAIIRWQASWWEPPAAKSQRLDLEATQTWTIR